MIAKLALLIRQLQGALGNVRVAAGYVTGSGGSSYSLTSGSGIVSVAGQATGRCRVVLDGAAAASNRIWVTANVRDNGAYHCTIIEISASPATFDVYQWDAAGVAANRSFQFHAIYEPA